MINDRYIIKSKLGEGRSSVYLCKDIEFPEKDIAIKILSPSANKAESNTFIQEYFTLRKLNHPNIIQANNKGVVVKSNLDDYSIEPGSRYFTLEYVKGKSLLLFPLRRKEQLKEIIKSLSSALYYLHQSNYIYYDLKPENVIVSEAYGGLYLKLIDFGFADVRANSIASVRGTAEYIAPELIKRESYDHRIDIYSFGILLYRLVYDKFPFEAAAEIDIYKAHIESEFEFPTIDVWPGLEKGIEKLLKKDPSERFENSLQLLDFLEIPVDDSVVGSLTPAKVFANRKDAQNILRKYLSDKSSSEVFSVKGSKGAGKTTLLNEIYFEYRSSVLITNRKSSTGYKFITGLIHRIIHNENVYGKLPSELLNKIEALGDEPPKDLIEEIKSIFTQLSLKADFILLLDDFNHYDDFSYEVLKELIPIFQVNRIKVILSENSDINYLSEAFHNLREINLTPFTEVHLNEYLDKSFYDKFPKQDLRKLILLYADLLPGNIDGFIKDLLLLKIIKYSSEGIKVETEENIKHLLQGSHEEIYRLRVQNLSEKELKVSRLLSSFSIPLEPRITARILEIPLEEMYSILIKLQQKNIIQQFRINTNPNFTSDSLKSFIYEGIENKHEYHLFVAEALTTKFNGFNNNELSRHFELAHEYEKTYNILMEELASAEKFSAFAYQKRLLEHLAALPLDDENKIKVKFELAKAYYKLSECKPSLIVIEELLKNKIESEIKNQIISLWASCLVTLGELKKGLEKYKALLPQINDEQKKLSLLTDIAHVEFDMNNYSEATALCVEVIDNKSGYEDKGKCYNLLGLIDIFRDNNLNSALINFGEAKNYFEKANLNFRLSQMEMNLGNIHNLKGDFKSAEEHWNKSLEINLSVGSLEQEAKLLLNFGIYYYDQALFEKSIENYTRAESIFLSLGNKHGRGLVLSNLGEIYILTCEYKKAFAALNEARSIFNSLHNTDEKFIALFLLGKLYASIGDYVSLKKIIKKYEEKPDILNENERHKNNYEFLLVLNKTGDSLSDISSRLKKIKGSYLKGEDKHNYFSASIISAEVLVKQKKYKAAFEALYSSEIQNIAENNLLYKAERLHMLGKLSHLDPSLGLKPAVDILKEAYEIVQDISITETTWKIMLALGISYVQRGNFGKAKEFIIYAKALLDYISQKLDEKQKHNYLKDDERVYALEKIDEIEKQYT